MDLFSSLCYSLQYVAPGLCPAVRCTGLFSHCPNISRSSWPYILSLDSRYTLIFRILLLLVLQFEVVLSFSWAMVPAPLCGVLIQGVQQLWPGFFMPFQLLCQVAFMPT